MCGRNRQTRILAAAALVLGAVAVLMVPAIASAQARATAVFKFAGMNAANPRVSLIPALGGGAVKMAVAVIREDNEDGDTVSVYQDPVILGIFEKALPGEMFKIEYSVIGGASPSVIRSAEPYEMTPGEDVPGVFIFQGAQTRKAGNVQQQLVTVQKFLKSGTLVVPSKVGADKKMEPDAKMMDLIGSLKSGDAVEVQLEAGSTTIKSIYAYVHPRRVDFVKVFHEKVEGRMVTGIVVKDDDETAKLPVDPKDPAGAALIAKLAAFKPHQTVLVRSREGDGHTWLAEISVAPKEPASRPRS